MKVEKYIRISFIMLCFLLWASTFSGQTATGVLHGQVTDPSGAAIIGATAVMTPASGSPVAVQSNAQGMYEFKGLQPGKFTLTIVAQGFNLYENDNVVIADQPLRLNVPLSIEVQEQKVQVSDTAPTIDVNPASNAGAIVISGKELDALPDDPDELQSDLEALAGPSAGPNGGQMYIDGFTAGQLPPKSSIREIRINQNPFSSEYDKLGYGRIEVFTKPGTDKYHGQLFASGNDSPFNSSNPFVDSEPPYYSTQFSGNIGGPIKKSASFFFNVERRNIDEFSATNAFVLDPTLTTWTQVAEAVPNPRARTNIGPRLDWALSKNNTLTARYQYYRDTETNNGVGQLSLPSQAYDSTSTEQTLQISDTQVIGSKIVNETRFQYNRDQDNQNPLDVNPAVSVQGTFVGGGSEQGTSNDLQNRYEVQNYTSLIHGNHILKFGGRFRATHEISGTTAGFNGSFTFPSQDAYQNAEQNLQAGATTTSGASQLVQTQGSPNASVTYLDVGLYIQDDWRVRPNITLSSGLRFETQNDIHDHGNWAPRLGIAWGVGGKSAPPKVVIRGGFGIFFDRFQSAQILQADRLNGVTQQQFVIDSPTCYPGLNVPLTTPISGCGAASSSSTAIYQISPRLHAPYTLQAAVSAERQVTKSATVSVTYLNSRGFDQFLTVSSNAPFPGTPCTPNCKLPSTYVYQYVSEGNFTQNQLIVNSNVKVSSKVQLFGYYTLNYAKGDTSGVSSFPSNSYNIRQDYGRASFDTRNRLFLGGTISFPYMFRLSPFLVASSGSPYNITAGSDLNGDSVFNDRPGLVSSATCPKVVTGPGSTIYCTPLGTFDASGAGKLLPINYGTGPSHFVLNLRLTKTFGLGPKAKGNTNQMQGGPGGPGGGRGGGGPRGPLFGGGGGMGGSANSDRRYNLIFGFSVRNVFNKVNLANPGGVLGSPFFGVSNALQGGPFSSSTAPRRIDLQATFSF
ncbi:MAG: carboxypeptidase regulatory-like domain-containing protein [Candidatus Sulfotelmatobacter sp.]